MLHHQQQLQDHENQVNNLFDENSNVMLAKTPGHKLTTLPAKTPFHNNASTNQQKTPLGLKTVLEEHQLQSKQTTVMLKKTHPALRDITNSAVRPSQLGAALLPSNSKHIAAHLSKKRSGEGVLSPVAAVPKPSLVAPSQLRNEGKRRVFLSQDLPSSDLSIEESEEESDENDTLDMETLRIRNILDRLDDLTDEEAIPEIEYAPYYTQTATNSDSDEDFGDDPLYQRIMARLRKSKQASPVTLYEEPPFSLGKGDDVFLEQIESNLDALIHKDVTGTKEETEEEEVDKFLSLIIP